MQTRKSSPRRNALSVARPSSAKRVRWRQWIYLRPQNILRQITRKTNVYLRPVSQRIGTPDRSDVNRALRAVLAMCDYGGGPAKNWRLERVRRPTGRPCRVTGNQRCHSRHRRVRRSTGCDPINIRARNTPSAAAALYTVKDTVRPIARGSSAATAAVRFLPWGITLWPDRWDPGQAPYRPRDTTVRVVSGFQSSRTDVTTCPRGPRGPESVPAFDPMSSRRKIAETGGQDATYFRSSITLSLLPNKM